MQINDSNVHIKFEAYAQKSRETAGAPERTPSPSGDASPVDKVVLSPKAREIQDARRQLDTVPDVDASRVEALRFKVETGVYQIDGGQIAERMLQEMTLNHKGQD
jgi:negative regulator of flagellin synthesis FlgM